MMPVIQILMFISLTLTTVITLQADYKPLQKVIAFLATGVMVFLAIAAPLVCVIVFMSLSILSNLLSLVKK